MDTNPLPTKPAPITEEQLATFKHIIRSRVRTYDVDRQGIVHNAIYLYWLEAARVEYFRAIGIPIDKQTFVSKHRFVVAHTDIDYYYAAEFDDEYEVLTKMKFVNNTSVGFEQIIRLYEDKELIVRSSTVMVHLNPASHQPTRIQDSYRDLFTTFESAAIGEFDYDPRI
jgi:acyl-CoA thioester hydrolase